MDAFVHVPQPAGAGSGSTVALVTTTAMARGAVASSCPPYFPQDERLTFMADITFVDAHGTSTTLDVPEGWSLMQAATANGVDGIIGECGGSCACATCHCYVDDSLMAVLAPAAANEIEMLENVAAERRPNSRLACQIKARAEMNGSTVTLPATQE
jgi:2Fe-2S ferredoxin